MRGMSGVWRAPLPVRWFLANAAPLLLVALVAAVVDERAHDSTVAVAGHLTLVLSAAALQALVLRSHGIAPWRWMLATLAGFGIGLVFGVGLFATLDGLGHETIGMGLGMVLLGAALGGTQSLVLRRGRARGALWTAGSAAAWLAFGLLWLAGWHYAHGTMSGRGALAPLARLYDTGNAELLLLAVGLAGYGLLTGALLSRVIR
ncbi:MAG: hypothetical protein ACREON_09595 [Gemmatimonadaceae bacterium]